MSMIPIKIQNFPSHFWTITDPEATPHIELRRQQLNMHGMPVGLPLIQRECDSVREAKDIIAERDGVDVP